MVLLLFTVYFPSKREYKNHDPIIILNDQDFENYRFSGSGDKNDPYIIEGLYINADLDAIRIQWTSKFFEIRNCKLESNERAVHIDSAASGAASIKDNIIDKGSISILLSHNTTIENNLMREGGFYSIKIENSIQTLIRNNTILNKEIGIFLAVADYITIEENFIYSEHIIEQNIGFFDYGNVGILSQGAHNTINNNTILNQDLGLYQKGNCALISNNNISNCSYGIFGWYMNVSTINNNRIFNNTEIGIHIQETNFANVLHNHCEENNISLQISASQFNEISNNTFLSNFIGLEIKVTGLGTMSYRKTLNNTVRFNFFAINSFYGLKNGWLCEFSKIYLNSFFFNNQAGTSQAYDEGDYSEWSNDNSEGNFWSEWLSGDYYIDGSSNSTDQFPLDYPPV